VRRIIESLLRHVASFVSLLMTGPAGGRPAPCRQTVTRWRGRGVSRSQLVNWSIGRRGGKGEQLAGGRGQQTKNGRAGDRERGRRNPEGALGCRRLEKKAIRRLVNWSMRDVRRTVRRWAVGGRRRRICLPVIFSPKIEKAGTMWYSGVGSGHQRGERYAADRSE
jgi:hypothetical protein